MNAIINLSLLLLRPQMSSRMSVMLPWAGMHMPWPMSHLPAEACTQRLDAGRGDVYQVTGIILQQQQLARSPVHIERSSTGRQV